MFELILFTDFWDSGEAHVFYMIIMRNASSSGHIANRVFLALIVLITIFLVEGLADTLDG